MIRFSVKKKKQKTYSNPWCPSSLFLLSRMVCWEREWHARKGLRSRTIQAFKLKIRCWRWKWHDRPWDDALFALEASYDANVLLEKLQRCGDLSTSRWRVWNSLRREWGGEPQPRGLWKWRGMSSAVEREGLGGEDDDKVDWGKAGWEKESCGVTAQRSWQLGKMWDGSVRYIPRRKCQCKQDLKPGVKNLACWKATVIMRGQWRRCASGLAVSGIDGSLPHGAMSRCKQIGEWRE